MGKPHASAPPPWSASADRHVAAAAMGDDASTLPYTPPPPLSWLYDRFFRHIDVDPTLRAAVHAAEARGTVVYVMRSLSFLDFLCLDHLSKREGLPAVRFVPDLGLACFEPFDRGRRRLRRQPLPSEQDCLRRTLDEAHSALLFLRRPPGMRSRRRRGEPLPVDHLALLIGWQRKHTRPLLLLPQTLVWSPRAASHERSLVDRFFGPSEWPGKLRMLSQLLLHHRQARLRCGEAFDLKAFVDERPRLNDTELARKLGFALLRRLERERGLVLGPVQKSPARLREELLRSPRVRQAMQAEARQSKRSMAEVEADAAGELRALCAAQHPWMLAAAHRILDWIWHRILDGLEVDTEGLERMRQAARQGSVVLIPSHKSHLDYLVLSDVMYAHALLPPLIAAGDNLNFWPIGSMLRRCGGFFIRRSFKGRRLYAALVDAYMRKLLVEGFAIEFFIEGGRSRSGKLLTPKFGLLSMIIDAAAMLSQRNVYFVPISIGYERVIEGRSYARELSGEEKQKENFAQLLRSSRVLSSRYGRLYVQFGDILDFRAMAAEGALGSANGALRLSPKQRRTLVQRIGHRIIYEMHQATMVTPVSLVASVLLSAPADEGANLAAIHQRATQMLALLRRQQARIARTLQGEDAASLDAALQQALTLLRASKLVQAHEDDDGVTRFVPLAERRLGLEFYRNNIVHFFVPPALVALAYLRCSSRQGDESDNGVEQPCLAAEVDALSRLFKHDFTFRQQHSAAENFERTLAQLAEEGTLACHEDRVVACDLPRLRAHATLLDPYLECRWLALLLLQAQGSQAVKRSDWLKTALSRGRKLWQQGELKLQESLSRDKLEHALMSLRDAGIVSFEGGDKVRLCTEKLQQAILDWSASPNRAPAPGMPA